MADIYDLIVIGGGSAGLTAAGFGVEVGARVALLEKNRLGGDCTWSGCVPSKSLLKAARVAHHIRTADRYGLPAGQVTADLRPVMARVRQIVAETYAEETPEALRAKGIDVYLGAFRFTDAHTLSDGATTVQGRNIIITTGAHPFAPPISGLDKVAYWTYETIWEQDVLPARLLVIGGGPIGAEMSQALARLGAQVTLLASGARLLSRDEPECSALLAKVFAREGVEVHFDTRAERVWQDEAGIHVAAGERTFHGDALLLVAGRRPNVDGLDLEYAGVTYTPQGIETDQYLRTTQEHILAAGDVLGGYQFTHYASWQAFTAARNALLPGKARGIADWSPWTTFTEPEIAHVGYTEAQARARHGGAVRVDILPLSRVDRARAESDEGLVKVISLKGKPLGVAIAAERAGEIIHEWLPVLNGRTSLRAMTQMMRIYPTYSRANVKAGGLLLQATFRGGLLGRLLAGLSRAMIGLNRLQRRF